MLLEQIADYAIREQTSKLSDEVIHHAKRAVIETSARRSHQRQGACFTFIRSSAVRTPLASLLASSLAQKCMK